MEIPGAIFPNAGNESRPLDFSAAIQGASIGRERELQVQRLNLNREAKQNTTSSNIQNQLNPDQLKGDVGDAPVGQEMSSILNDAQKDIRAGASEADIRTKYGDRIKKVSQYMTTAKIIDTQLENTLKTLPKDAGYNLDAIRAEAKKLAYTDGVDENGNPKLRDFTKIDPTTNYAAQVVREHPELVTNMSGIDKYIKELPKNDVEHTVVMPLPGGKKREAKISSKMNYFEDYDKDDAGNVKLDDNGHPAGIVPKFQVAMQNDKNGKQVPVLDPETGKPMRMMDTQNFDDMLAGKPELGDNLRGEVNRHLQAAGIHWEDNDPRKKMYAQALMYKEFMKQNNSTLHVDDKTTETAAASKENDPNFIANEVKRTRAITNARLQAEDDFENSHPDSGKAKQPKIKAPETVAQLFTNPKSVTDGAAIEKTPDGQQAYNVTEMFPGGKLNFKGGSGGAYTGAYYKPDTHELLVYKKGDTKPETVSADNAGQFMARIAEANGVPKAQIRPLLDNYGFGKGKFKAGQSPDLAAPINAAKDAQAEDTQKKVKTFIDTEKPDSIKGLKTPDGTITDANVRGGFKTGLGMDKYSIELSKGGKKTTKTFASKDELNKYLLGTTGNTSSGGFNPEDAINKYK